MYLCTALLLTIYLACKGYSRILPPPCTSEIFCHGPLLHTVQLAKIFNDSKAFVDKKMLHAPNETLHNFADFMQAANGTPSKFQVQEFVAANFGDGNELEDWNPPDYKPNPEFLNQIENSTVQNYTRELISLWPRLARKMKAEVALNSDRYSFIPVSNGFIIPGGRFREYYYWDSYWIIKGLLISGMTETARGMIDNFISVVERHGFIPNGGRVYYLNRSQPPLLTAMAYDYFKQTNDIKWLTDNIEHLDKELRFWLENRTMNVQLGKFNLTLARYSAESSGPRPESYAEDHATASYYQDPEKQQQLYVDLKSGAEAGWDFSSRWLFDETGGNLANLSNINTRRVIPVDLNAFLCGAFKDMAKMYLELGDLEKTTFWMVKALEWRKAIELSMWDEEDGIWYDLDSKLMKSRKYFFPSSLAPLWARCFDTKQGPRLGKQVAKFLDKKGLLNHIGGIPTSLAQTGEQWDFPNAWPPLQDIVVQGLENSGSPEAQKMARDFARRWVNANIIGYTQTGEMFEKYDAVTPGKYGGGGEYTVQTGFGWSNGVVLKFIYDYFRNV